MKTFIVLLLTLASAGCGTVNTVFRSDAAVSQGLGHRKTYCDTVPRIYSGVAYDFCVLNAPDISPAGSNMNFVPGIPLVLVDMVVSGVVDTVVLPYSIYQQSTNGSIPVSRAQ